MDTRTQYWSVGKDHVLGVATPWRSHSDAYGPDGIARACSYRS